jgi:tryptophanyl-tRNA synthetase
MVMLAALTSRTVPEVQAEFVGRMYGDLKKAAAAAFREFAEPVAARVGELLADPAELDRLMAIGAGRAREVAAQTLADVNDLVGFVPPGKRAHP